MNIEFGFKKDKEATSYGTRTSFSQKEAQYRYVQEYRIEAQEVQIGG